jgi:cytoplasmic iron level regulating protein YaaA (DUF328/UPF0246 family)
MKILISPAKSIDIQKLKADVEPTTAIFLSESESLIKKLQKFSSTKIAEMMHVSTPIADLNYERFQTWENPVVENEMVKPAISCFTGEVYRGLDAKTLDTKQMEKTQNDLRILSGLYGVLKPMDLMFPYRLEMGTKWAVTPKMKNLYQFWGKKLSQSLNDEMMEGEELINLASIEYFKAVDLKVLKAKVVTPVFKELKNGEYKVVMTYAKNARGRMTRYLIENNIEQAEEMKGFNWDGYLFHESLSSENEWVFTR